MEEERVIVHQDEREEDNYLDMETIKQLEENSYVNRVLFNEKLKRMKKIKARQKAIRTTAAVVSGAIVALTSKFGYEQIKGREYYSNKVKVLQEETGISFEKKSNELYGIVEENYLNASTSLKLLRDAAEQNNISDKELMLGLELYYGNDYLEIYKLVDKDNIPSFLEKVEMYIYGYHKIEEEKFEKKLKKSNIKY